METPKLDQQQRVFPCTMCNLVFQAFRCAMFIYFFWFLLAVLLSEFPSPGELISSIKRSVENYNMANIIQRQNQFNS